MPTERIILTHTIAKNLNLWTDLVKTHNSAGELTINKASENTLKDVINYIYDYALINSNLAISNYPAVDLIDDHKKICFQVTATNDIEKIKSTIKTFLSKGLHRKYDNLVIYLLVDSKGYYEKPFKDFLDPLKTKHSAESFTFSFNSNIWDKNILYKTISNELPVEKLNELNDLLINNIHEVRTRLNLSEYNKSLAESFFEVIMDDEAGLSLNDIYIDPYFSIYKGIFQEEQVVDYKKHNSEYIEPKDLISTHDLFTEILLGTARYDYLFKYPKAIVSFVLGYPGQGKTSFCKKLLHDYLRLESSKPIFYLKLRNVSNTKLLIDNPLSVIKEELEIELEQSISKVTLKGSIIILDGLDELYMKDDLKSEDIERFCKELIRDCEKHKYYKIIITSRYGYIDFKRLYNESLIAISLRPLPMHQQVQWLEKFRVFHPDTWLTTDMIDNFNRNPRKYNFIIELINQPLLLYIVSTLKTELTPETDRAEVYSALFDQIIERKYSKDGQIDLLKKVKKEDLRILLQEIAFLIFSNGKGFITSDELLKSTEIKEYISQIGDSNLQGTLKGVLISFYFKETRVNHVDDTSSYGIEFFHRSLQEYLTAEKIVDSCFWEILNKDQRNHYVLKTDYDVLKYLNNLLGRQILSFEISYYIKRLIIKKDFKLREELSNKLESHLGYLLQKDFVTEYKSEQFDVYDSIIKNFTAFWFILQKLGLNKNYIHDAKSGQKIMRLLMSANNFYSCGYALIVSNMKFEDVEFHNVLSGSHEQSFSNMTLIGCSIDVSNLFSQPFNNCKFTSTFMAELRMYQSGFVNCVLESGAIYGMILYSGAIQNCTFKDYEIRGLSLGADDSKKPKLSRLKFQNVEFDPESFAVLKDNCRSLYLKDCRVRITKGETQKIEDRIK